MRRLADFLDRIICGDCVKVLHEMPSASVDLVVTDPPYLAHYRSRDGRGVVNDDHGRWILPAFAEIYRVLKPNRFCVSFYGWHQVERFMAEWKWIGFRPVGHLVFVKEYASKTGFTRARHECAYLLAKGEPRKPSRPPSDVSGFAYTGNRLHPTQKPVGVFRDVIAAYSRFGDVVLDPFAGSGPALLATKHLGRRFIGIELVPRYCRIAQDRLR